MGCTSSKPSVVAGRNAKKGIRHGNPQGAAIANGTAQAHGGKRASASTVVSSEPKKVLVPVVEKIDGDVNTAGGVINNLNIQANGKQPAGDHVNLSEQHLYDCYNCEKDFESPPCGGNNFAPGSEGSGTGKAKIQPGDEANRVYRSFMQFDIVRDCSDHHFFKNKVGTSQIWVKKIQQEWKILEKDLPGTIFVRAYEDRMDLLRAVIIGSAGTPYHDGLFFFDIHFPSNYPKSPPLVHYLSGGLRLNPNLYANGTVCLSLLNTWPSWRKCEKWNPSSSTMLQVLVSLQALVLNAKPYFNEPSFISSANTTSGEKRSLAYNESTFLLSCKTMLYSIRKPPKHFEGFVALHFRLKGRDIMAACKAYMTGAQVGCFVADVDKRPGQQHDKGSSLEFRKSLNSLSEMLLVEFVVKGADCREFQRKP